MRRCRTPFALSALVLAAGCASLPAGPGAKAPTTSVPAAAPATVPPVHPAQPPAAGGLPAAAPASGSPAPTAAAPPPGGAPAAAAPAPGAPPAFAVVTKDASSTDALFTVWRKDDKTWLELKPDDLDQTFFLSPKYATGIGESMLFGGLMASTWGEAIGRPQAIEFRRVNNQIQLIARNMAYAAREGTPEAQAVKTAYSPSLLASTAVASQPHPDRKSILVDASALFVGDMAGIGMALQRAYRQNYNFDARNSALSTLRGGPDQLEVTVQNHYVAPSIAMPQPNAPPGAPVPSTPGTLPDVRSLFMTLQYSLSRLPAQPMQARKADPRVGYFQTTIADFSDDLARTPRQRFVNRWRLEKKDPAAALSEPVKPIVFWLDRSVPVKYRPALTAGILEWNKAFERIGFKDAVRVETQATDADFDTLDGNRASVRWMTNASPSFGAIGPSHVDPRTGEILDADIGFESLSSRTLRAVRSQILTPPPDTMPGFAPPVAVGPAGAHVHDPALCQHADFAAEQLGYALDVLEARGELDPDGPEAEQFVEAYLKDVTMHEVGHTLGLRHNFRASRLYTDAQLSDPAFTQANGNTGSVMEYAPINLPAPGQRGGTPFQTTLGPYDYWAIEYGYKPFAADAEAGELLAIAGRNADPLLAYGTDEDNYLGIDPESIHYDLGNDPLAFARKRFAIARDLLQRQEQRTLRPNADYAVLRRSVAYAVRDMARASGVLARQIGGIRTLRDFPGTGRDPLQPVSADLQRDALDLLARNVLSAEALKVSPALQRRMAPDYEERGDALREGEGAVATDFSLTQTVFQVQRAVLGQLMSDPVASRILDSEAKADVPTQAFRLSELYRRLSQDVWSELGRGGDIPLLRRELQREHVNRLATVLLRPGALSRADARSLMRAEARALLPKLEAGAAAPGRSAEARAHLQDSAETLRQALEAKLQRAGA